MSTRRRKFFVVAAFITVFASLNAAAAAEEAHNLILIIPEALPANSINPSNAPALTELRRQGVTFANSHAGFPRLGRTERSSLGAQSLLAAASDFYAPPLMVDDGTGAELQQLVNVTLPQAKEAHQPFFIVYALKQPKGLDSAQSDKEARPAFKPNPRAVDDALAAIEATLKTLGLYDTTNIVVAAESAFARVLKTSHTSLARSVLPREETLGVLPPGFLALDLTAALAIGNDRLQLFDPDAGKSYVARDKGGHPLQGNGIIAADYYPSTPHVTIEAHGAYDSIYFSPSMSTAERRATARVILDTVLSQDYRGGVFVNEKQVGLFRGALPMSHITRPGEQGLPDILVLFAAYDERCAPSQLCSSVVADTPLIEGEGIANPFSRTGGATFMAARGPDFRVGVTSDIPASNADMGRTIADLLDLDLDPPDRHNARVLHEALTGKRHRMSAAALPQTMASTPTLDGVVTELHLQTLGKTVYFDSAVAVHREALAADLDPPRRWRWPFRTLEIKISEDPF